MDGHLLCRNTQRWRILPWPVRRPSTRHPCTRSEGRGWSALHQWTQPPNDRRDVVSKPLLQRLVKLHWTLCPQIQFPEMDRHICQKPFRASSNQSVKRHRPKYLSDWLSAQSSTKTHGKEYSRCSLDSGLPTYHNYVCIKTWCITDLNVTQGTFPWTNVI